VSATIAANVTASAAIVLLRALTCPPYELSCRNLDGGSNRKLAFFTSM